VRLAVVAAERRRLLKLRREREIGDEILHKLMREIDLAPLEAALGPAAAPPRPRRAKPGRFR
jgi:hypothetical protein